MDSLPQPQTNSVGINTKTLHNAAKGISARTLQDFEPNQQPKKTRRKQTVTKTTVPLDGDEAARVDVYYFDHGNSG